jgi:hypothetical protein
VAGKAPHLVAALAHGIGAVLGQAAVDAKLNEIPAVSDLLKAFTDLAGAVITIDAMHTQADTAQVITARGANSRPRWYRWRPGARFGRDCAGHHSTVIAMQIFSISVG